MSYQFYTTEKDEAKLKNNILEQMKSAGVKTETVGTWDTDRLKVIAVNKLASSFAKAIKNAQMTYDSQSANPSLSFALKTRAELLQDTTAMYVLGEMADTLSKENKEGKKFTADDVLTGLTGVNSKEKPVPFIINDPKNLGQTKKITTLYDGLQIGAPTPNVAKATPPAAAQQVVVNIDKGVQQVSTGQRGTATRDTKPATASPKTAKQTPPATTATAAAATSTANDSTDAPPIPTTPPQQKSDFERKYIGLTMIFGDTADKINESVTKSNTKLKQDSINDIKTLISEALKPELHRRHIEFADADLAAVADATSQAIVEHIHAKKAKDPNFKLDSISKLQAESDALGKEIRAALGKAGKDGKLGKLADDFFHPYADTLSGVSETGEVTNRYGTNFHTLGATALAQAFGTEDVQENHKRAVAKKYAHSNFQSQGGVLDSSAIDQSVDAALGDAYAPATHNKVKSIAQKTFYEKDVWGDTMAAWNAMADEENAKGKNGFMDVIKRFFLMLDALLENFTGFSLLGAGNNPLTARSKEIGNERHIKATHQTILETPPLELGWSAETKIDAFKWRQELAERVTGVNKDGKPITKDGHEIGLNAVVHGLDVQGKLEGMDVVPQTSTPPSSQKVAQERARAALAAPAADAARAPYSLPRPEQGRTAAVL
jgi:hypothetical protein